MVVSEAVAYYPKSLDAACEILGNEPCHIIAGGTDLMVKYRRDSGIIPAFSKPLLFCQNISELHVLYHENDQVVIGAGVPLETILAYHKSPKLLRQAIAQMASPGIRHLATLGGNVGNASPAGDTLPVLSILEARILVDGQQGRRIVDLKELISGPGKTTLKQDEIITAFVIKDAHRGRREYVKVGGRKSDAISKVSFAGYSLWHEEQLIKFRVAFGAVGPTIVRDCAIEKWVSGFNASTFRSKIPDMVEAYAPFILPIDDQRSSASYRKAVALNLLREFLLKTGGDTL